jgi:hypothetical protein
VNPPEKRLGVSRANQGKFLKQTVARLKQFPQVAGMTWYLLRDERTLGGWQSGTYSYFGQKPRSAMHLAWRSVLR